MFFEKMYWEKYGKVFRIMVFCILFALSIVRICSGLNIYDESFYISNTLRFINGDAMLVDEWHTTQMMGFLLYPFVYMYLLVTGKNDGIILYMRLIYVLVKLLIFLFILLRRKKRDIQKYFLPVSIFFLFTPYNIYSLSYNTVGILAAILGLVLMFDSENCMPVNILCGLCMACVVLCNPYAIILIAGMMTYLIVECRFEKDYKLSRNSKKKLVGILIGGCVLLGLFLCFVFSRTNLNNLLQNLPFILDDSEHSESLLEKLVEFPFIVRHFLPKTTKWYLLSLLILIVMKKMIYHTKYWEMIKRIGYFSVILFAVCDAVYIETHYGAASINIWMQCIFRYGILILIIKDNSDTKLILRVMLGYLYSLCVYFCSNTAGLSYTAALVVPCFFLLSDMKNETADKLINKYCTKFIIGLMGGILIFNACYYNWLEEDTTYCNRRINKGPAKMLFVSQEMEEKYLSFIQVADELEISPNDYLLCKKMNPIIYIYTNCRVGSYSTFALSLEYSKLKDYFELHPQNAPSIVFYENENLTSADKQFINEQLSEGYEKRNISTGLAYVKYSDKR